MDKNNTVVIRFENISKTYKLGKFNGRTLQQSFQSWWALKRGKEDPNLKIGKRIDETGRFQALHQISCEIYEGERVGIIGRNGAGKSTLLKLLSRVTCPSDGEIYIKGKISSMLEVGTGFHGELTGRENIYLNGAILGMTKQEVDDKIEDIIEFSECEQFIDTPVKRYSSGMYVKLAFSVAAFLSADIFLMDEVLAVGDMTFQKKCLNKMKEISENKNKTILYVSHNMQTIRELCSRCIVLDQGQIIYDGNVEDGIGLYMKDILEVKHVYEFKHVQKSRQETGNIRIRRIEIDRPIQGKEDTVLNMKMYIDSLQSYSGIHMRFSVYDYQDQVVSTGFSQGFATKKDESCCVEFVIPTSLLTEGEYSADIALVEPWGGRQTRHAFLKRAIAFRIEKRERLYELNWNTRLWGSVDIGTILVKKVEEK